MLEIGQFFKKGDVEYGFLDSIQYEGVNYLYFSIEENKKVDYKFYTVKSFSEEKGYDLEPVMDEDLNMILFDIEYKRIKEQI